LNRSVNSIINASPNHLNLVLPVKVLANHEVSFNKGLKLFGLAEDLLAQKNAMLLECLNLKN